MIFQNTQAFAQELDAADKLKKFRNEFIFPTHHGKEAIYFLGNSLGLQPKNTSKYIQQVLNQWAQHGVEGFFRGEQPWLHYHDQLIHPLAGIVGALPQEIVVMNGLTVNLHLMLISFYQPSGKRNKILCESRAFPSDQYMLETHVQQRGLNPDEVIIEVAPKEGACIRQEDILSAIEKYKEELALVLWGGVNYYTGQVFDMENITKAAQAVGAKVGFDLAHAAGNILLHLHDWNVDFACWCNYKYLNSGPGAVAAAYVHERYHKDTSLQRLAGWWGYDSATRFQMQKGFVPIHTAEGWQLSTPSPIQYAAAKASFELFAQAGMNALYKKGRQLSDYLLFIIDEINKENKEKLIEVLTPPEAKGCQVSMLMQQNGRQVFEQLSRNGVFADWREPDVIRVAPVPLYNTFEEVWEFGRILHLLLRDCLKLSH
ncbi:MAG: kynureninase [Flavisolibacter sp.]|nr:kynureninase [Flavisolibacter sp.]